jgi:hypothetical protein
MYISMLYKSGEQKEKNVFFFDVDEHVEYVSSWSKYVTLKDFVEHLFQNSWLTTKYASVKSYFRHSANNLYSYWPVGAIPIQQMKQFKLRDVAHNDDVARLNKHDAKDPFSPNKTKQSTTTTETANLQDTTPKTGDTNTDSTINPYANQPRRLLYENADHPSEQRAEQISTPTTAKNKRTASKSPANKEVSDAKKNKKT